MNTFEKIVYLMSRNSYISNLHDNMNIGYNEYKKISELFDEYAPNFGIAIDTENLVSYRPVYISYEKTQDVFAVKGNETNIVDLLGDDFIEFIKTLNGKNVYSISFYKFIEDETFVPAIGTLIRVEEV